MRDRTADGVNGLVGDEQVDVGPLRPEGVIAGSPNAWQPCHQPYAVVTTWGCSDSLNLALSLTLPEAVSNTAQSPSSIPAAWAVRG